MSYKRFGTSVQFLTLFTSLYDIHKISCIKIFQNFCKHGHILLSLFIIFKLWAFS